MASKPVTLGEYSFSSKKEAKELYSKILNSAELDEPLTGDNFSHVMALLLHHPSVKKKIADGVESIVVGVGKYKGDRCFHVIRKDGSKDNFSIKKCIDGENSDFHKFCIACRKTVEEEIKQFKIKYFEDESDENNRVKCQATGLKILKDESHVDHREPFTFSAIVHFFIQANHIDLTSVKYDTKGKYGNEFLDSILVDNFQVWHRKNAKLRVVSKDKNMEKTYLGRIKSTKADRTL